MEDTIEKEHLHERALGGPDEWGNWRWSHEACHSIVTNGTKATAAGSSKHRIAKARRIATGGKTRKGPPMAGSRASRWKRKMDGSVVER